MRERPTTRALWSRSWMLQVVSGLRSPRPGPPNLYPVTARILYRGRTGGSGSFPHQEGTVPLCSFIGEAAAGVSEAASVCPTAAAGRAGARARRSGARRSLADPFELVDEPLPFHLRVGERRDEYVVAGPGVLAVAEHEREVVDERVEDRGTVQVLRRRPGPRVELGRRRLTAPQVGHVSNPDTG